MTYRRGAALTTVTTLGYADTADLGPTAGNGFYKQWPDDLALLQDLGITDVRVALDWSRLQSKPGELDGDWSERFENVLEAAEAIGLRSWVTLYERSIPRWLDNEGGFGDDDAVLKWWPRWVERAADRFGDHVAGWIPFAEIPRGLPAQPWIDTWSILENGDQPVVASVDAATVADSVADYAGRIDRLGLVLPTTWASDAALGEHELAQSADEWGTTVRSAADATGVPLVLSGFGPGHDDADTADEIIETFLAMIDDAVDDGVDIDVCFIDPAIAGPDSNFGLLDQGRAPTATAAKFLPTVDSTA